MADKLDISAFEIFDKSWALVTAGTLKDFNTMTISWGGLGTLWSKPVATVYIKPVRHTWQYMNQSEYFSVSFYDEDYRQDLLTLGTKSGRDGDKVALTRLNAVESDGIVTFKQAKITLVCRKIYWQDMNRDAMPEDVIKTYYETEEPHRMYVGEVVKVIRQG